MRLTQILLVLFVSCAFVKDCECERVLRRNVNVSRDQQTTLRLETVAGRIEEKLEKFDEKISSIFKRLEDLDDKISKVNDKLFNEKLSDEAATLPINAQLVLWDEKISELDRKLSQLINQTDERRFYDAKRDNEPLQFKLPENVQPLELEIISQQMKETFENFGEKIQRNLSENGEKLDQLRRYLQLIFDETAKKKNSTRPDDLLMQIQRKERRIAEHTSLINEILTMVRDRLKSEEEDDMKKISGGSLTKMVSSFENMKSSTLAQRNKTTLPSRKGGIIFPNVKNKPAKINTAFTSDAFDIKDFKVSLGS
jgi:hypothetical protein